MDIDRVYKIRNIDGLNALKLTLCMNCGSCTYVCPADRKLAETNQLISGKWEIYKMKKLIVSPSPTCRCDCIMRFVPAAASALRFATLSRSMILLCELG